MLFVSSSQQLTWLALAQHISALKALSKQSHFEIQRNVTWYSSSSLAESSRVHGSTGVVLHDLVLYPSLQGSNCGPILIVLYHPLSHGRKRHAFSFTASFANLLTAIKAESI